MAPLAPLRFLFSPVCPSISTHRHYGQPKLTVHKVESQHSTFVGSRSSLTSMEMFLPPKRRASASALSVRPCLALGRPPLLSRPIHLSPDVTLRGRKRRGREGGRRRPRSHCSGRTPSTEPVSIFGSSFGWGSSGTLHEITLYPPSTHTAMDLIFCQGI